MVLAQFGDDSDVYMFDTRDELICQWCKLGNGSANWTSRGKPDSLAAHVEAHRQAGHNVPDGLLDGRAP